MVGYPVERFLALQALLASLEHVAERLNDLAVAVKREQQDSERVPVIVDKES